MKHLYDGKLTIKVLQASNCLAQATIDTLV
jgi:hypothetical protein